MHKLSVLLALAALAVLAAAAPAHAAVRALPAAKRTLAANAAVPRDCAATAPRTARGVDVTRWRAPMSGFLNVRMRGARRSDWDLVLVDSASRRRLATSQAFGSREVAQSWVAAGQRVTVVGCRRSGRARSAAVSLQLLDLKPPRVTGTPSLVRVKLEGEGDLHRLERLGLDVTHNVRETWADVVLANAAQRALLGRAGFDATTRIADLQSHFVRSRRADARFTRAVGGDSSLPSGRTTYRVYADYQRELKELAERNRGLVRPVTLPHPSFQGRSVEGVEIAQDVDRSAEDGRPVYLLVAMHHAREWPSSESAMEFAHMLVQQRRNKRVREVLENVRTVIVPLVNPDGFISSRGAVDPADTARDLGLNPNLDDPTPGDDPGDCTVDTAECETYPSLVEGIAPPGGLFAYRRKNCNGAVPDGRVPCELQWGVDPNRNYGEGWGGPGSSADPTTQGYRGTGPWSEPETQNIHEYSQRRQVTTLITLHNVAALVLRPPGIHDKGRAPDEAALRQLGDAMGRAAGYTSQYGFQLYDTAGTTEDWNYAAAGTFGYTIEIGPAGGEFHMPYRTGVVEQWDGTYAGNGQGLREALLLAAENAGDPTYHSVISGRAGPGRTLRLSKSFDTFTSAYCDVTVNPPVYFTGGPGTLILPESRCVGEHPPTPIADGLNSTLRVPKNGRYEWHVTPSTRPFVGQTSKLGEIDTAASTRTDEWVNTQPTSKATADPTWDAKWFIGGFPAPEGSYIDKEFTLTTDDDAAQLDVIVDGFAAPNDYDVQLFRRARSGKLVLVDTSAGAAGAAERITIGSADLQFGTYVLRVVNYNADDPAWSARVYRRPRKPDTVTPGTKEAWTLTCEDGDGTVLAQRSVVVDRGQRVPADLIC